MRLTRMVGAVALAAAFTGASLPAPARAQTNASGNFIIKSINLTGLSLDPVTGVLSATGGTITGTLAGLPFTTNINHFVLTPLPEGPGGCAILDLGLAPIHLQLLGLHVDTSAICLSITAFHGQGILGDLLCSLADGNLPLLGSPDLLSGLTEILTQALGQGQTPQADGNGMVCTGTCEILHLVLGPLDLDLLGVNVHLDNCNNGPVEVCVSSTASEGILGQLLCGLTNGQLLGLDLKDIAQLVKKATTLLKLHGGVLTAGDIATLTNLLFRLLG